MNPCSPCCRETCEEDNVIRELDLLIEVCGHCESAPVLWYFTFSLALQNCPAGTVVMHHAGGCTWESFCLPCGDADATVKWVLTLDGTSQGSVTLRLVGLEGINLEYTNEVEWNCDRTNELHISEASAEENADYPALLCLDGGGVTTVCGTSVQGVASPITIDCGDCEADNPASWRALASGVCQGFTLEYTPDCIYQTVETYKCGGDDEPWVLDVAGNSSPQSVSLSHGDLTYRNPAAWQCLRANLMVLDDDDESGCSVAADTPRYICLVPGETDLSAECFPVCEAVAQRYQLTISGVQNTEHCDNCQGSNGTWLLEDPQRFPFNPCWWEADLPFACNRCLGNPPPEPNPSDPSPHAVFRFGSFGASGNAEVIISTSSYTNSFGCSGCTEAIYRGQANCLGTMVLNRFAAGLLPCSPGPLYPQSCVWPSSVTVTAIP